MKLIHLKILNTFLWVAIGCCLPFPLISQEYSFEYNEVSRVIYRSIIDLKLEQAEKELDLAIADDPYNLSHLHLRSYLDFFGLFISEEGDKFEQLSDRKDKSIKLIKNNLADENPYKQFAIAEIQLHSAIARSKFGQLFRASREILSAYKGLSRNNEEFPDFIYNKKSLSVIHSLIETVAIPGLIKKFFGIDGSIELGLQEIEEVIQHSHKNEDFIFHEEVDAIYLYILFYQANDKTKALKYLEESRLNPKESRLANFLIATFHQRSGANNKALAVLENKPTGKAYSEFLYLDLLEGISYLRANNVKGVDYIKKYAQDFKGRHYIKEAYQKLAWSSLIFENNVPQYKFYMEQVENHGHDLVDADKQALKESQSKKIPNTTLLKARLLFDGGYYNKAYNLLIQNAHQYISESETKHEFDYRMGRITHALKNYPEALIYYNNTINYKGVSQSYYACNAALQAALIYESQNNKESALEYYNKCLSLEPSEYKNSLHQKAKSGKQRIEK